MHSASRLLLLVVAVLAADDAASDAKAAAAADHLRAGELRELLTKAGVEFGCLSAQPTVVAGLSQPAPC